MMGIHLRPAPSDDGVRPLAQRWPSVRSIIFLLLVVKIVLDVLQRRRNARLAKIPQTGMRLAARRLN